MTDAGSGVSSVTAYILVNGILDDWWWYITLSNGGSGNAYAGTFDIGENDTGLPNDYTAYILATDGAGNTTAVKANGSCAQPSETAAVTPPVISAAAILPASLPVTGGTITINATVTDAGGPGLQYVNAQLFRDNAYYTTISLGYSGSGDVYTGTYTLNANTDLVAHVYTAVVYAVDNINTQATLPAVGSTTVATDNAGPSISAATLTPASLDAIGGTLSVNATVTDPQGIYIVEAQLFVNGVYNGSYPLSNTTGASYATTIAIGENNGADPNVYTVVILAENNLYTSSSLAASGATIQAADNAAPVISAASLTPSTLPYAGGTLSVTATITDPEGIYNAYAQIIEDGSLYVTEMSLSPSPDGQPNDWAGSWTSAQNNDAVTHTFTAVVYAGDNLGNRSTQAATGTTILAANPAQPITLASAALTPAALPATGGTITVSATVTDATWVSGIVATILRDGVFYQNLTLDNGGSGVVYSGQCDIGVNRDLIAHSYTAVVYATNTVGTTTSLPALGACVVATDRSAPVITGATLTPSSRPDSGGTLYISVTITDSGDTGLAWESADIYNNGTYATAISLSNGGSGDLYTGSYTFPANNSNQNATWTATVAAADNAGNSAAVPASGSCRNQTGSKIANGPAISGAAITPATCRQPGEALPSPPR